MEGGRWKEEKEGRGEGGERMEGGRWEEEKGRRE